jgi:acyl-CoA thioester hydrolase
VEAHISAQTFSTPEVLTAAAEIVIPFHDVDSMGIVWHGNYMKYFEISRCELLDKLEFGYTEMALSDYAWPIIGVNVKYIQPIRFKQKIVVTSTLKECEYRLRINYEITDAISRERLTKGHTTQAAVDRKTNEMCLPLPQVVREKYNQLPLE